VNKYKTPNAAFLGGIFLMLFKILFWDCCGYLADPNMITKIKETADINC
jgi:hypothetical protein